MQRKLVLAALGKLFFILSVLQRDWYSYQGPIGTIHRAGSKLWIYSQKLESPDLTSDSLKRPNRSWEATMLPDHIALISFIIHRSGDRQGSQWF
jgi:hypothetical protein